MAQDLSAADVVRLKGQLRRHSLSVLLVQVTAVEGMPFFIILMLLLLLVLLVLLLWLCWLLVLLLELLLLLLLLLLALLKGSWARMVFEQTSVEALFARSLERRGLKRPAPLTPFVPENAKHGADDETFSNCALGRASDDVKSSLVALASEWAILLCLDLET